MIKDIIKNLKPSSTLLINEKSNKLEREGKKIFKFGVEKIDYLKILDINKMIKPYKKNSKYDN